MTGLMTKEEVKSELAKLFESISAKVAAQYDHSVKNNISCGILTVEEVGPNAINSGIVSGLTQMHGWSVDDVMSLCADLMDDVNDPNTAAELRAKAEEQMEEQMENPLPDEEVMNSAEVAYSQPSPSSEDLNSAVEGVIAQIRVSAGKPIIISDPARVSVLSCARSRLALRRVGVAVLVGHDSIKVFPLEKLPEVGPRVYNVA